MAVRKTHSAVEVGLPAMDGYELAARLRQLPRELVMRCPADATRFQGQSRLIMRRTKRNRGTLAAVLITFVLTLLAVLVVLNISGGEKKIDQRIPHLYSIADPQFHRTMGVLLGPAILDGNRFEVLLNGDQIFPAMLSAIRSAQRSITFETYIYWSGTIGKAFADALSERARSGVKVHVLLDWVGSNKLEQTNLDEMTRAGVEVRRYHEPHWYNLSRLNNRTHRKLLIVDGKVGFTGGVGIADEWTGDAQDPNHWRDTHFRAEGPVVAEMQAVFLDNWMKITGDVLHSAAYFPELSPVGAGKAQMFSSSPTGGAESMHLMYLLAITAASRSIELSMAYFVPRRSRRAHARRSARAGGQSADHHARSVWRCQRCTARIAGALGRIARSGGAAVRIPAHHVSLQGTRGRWADGIGGIHEL